MKNKKSQYIQQVKKKPELASKKLSIGHVIVIILLIVGFVALLLAAYFFSGISVNTIHK
jgi:uncharacterized membrane protein (DUF485 family)